ncbi:MAG TPA: hypothetical protein VMM18_09860 [Gemmatimonadaceae bacterium]|nr:hypothetical protein [Gemmatimonadaceae bacterium]
MNARYMLTGAVAAAVALFVWQSVSHMALPLHDTTMTMITNDTAYVEAVRAAAPTNGIYFAPRGVLTIVNFAPDLSDQTQAIGTRLGMQFAVNLGVGLLLALAMLRLAAGSVLSRAGTLALLALAGALLTRASDGVWFGFTTRFVMVNTLDLVVGWFLAGVVLALLHDRMAVPGMRSDGVKGGELPSRDPLQPARR